MLLDVTRLVWRVWRGRQATGIDRVCFAYMDALGSRALAIVQRRGLRLLFSRRGSDELFAILRQGGPEARRRLLLFFATRGAGALARRPRDGSLYLNVGHTGLNDDSLRSWIARFRLQAVYLIHDLIPITHPETCRPGECERHEQRMRNALLSAAGIIGNSQATLDELAAFADRQALTMPPSIAAWIAGKPVHKPASRGPAAQPYFVVLGTIEPRKNHKLLLDVWERLLSKRGRAAPKLLIIGARGWEATDIFRRLDDLGALREHVQEMGSCSDDELTDLLAGASALLMPSLAEGYGLPVFEGLGMGTPVIAADLPVYREIVGDLPVYLGPDDLEGWTSAILDASDAGIAEQERRRIAGYRAPTWAEHFAAVESWLSKLSDPQSPVEPSRDSTKERAGDTKQSSGRVSANS
jgi:glycosyltransferase involved in cell wall biosynthesis